MFCLKRDNVNNVLSIVNSKNRDVTDRRQNRTLAEWQNLRPRNGPRQKAKDENEKNMIKKEKEKIGRKIDSE